MSKASMLFTMLGASCIVLVVALACGQSGSGESKDHDGDSTDDDTDDGTDGTDNGTDDTDVPEEQCNGLDDNENGQVDEGCPCEDGEEQDCYPAPHPPPEGCEYGTQVCAAGEWGGPCEGAKTPPEGALKCCRILEDEENPAHEVLDQCVAIYAVDQIPGCYDIAGWSADDADCAFSHITSNVADEFVDKHVGGITVANVEQGRAYTRQVALDDFGVTDDDILHEVTLPVEIEGVTGCDPGGKGFAWGSILYRTSLGAVGEIVYLYVGVCKDNCDAEAFLRSAEPILVCSEGTLY